MKNLDIRKSTVTLAACGGQNFENFSEKEKQSGGGLLLFDIDIGNLCGLSFLNQ